MKISRKGLWIVAGIGIVVGAAAFNALFLSAMALAFFPKFNFTTVAQVICRKDETILYRTEPGSAYTDPEGNVSYPDEIFISCVAEDGTKRKGLEAQAIFTVWGIYWLIFFLIAILVISLFLVFYLWNSARQKKVNERLNEELG